jgi:hypothetical protein
MGTESLVERADLDRFAVAKEHPTGPGSWAIEQNG